MNKTVITISERRTATIRYVLEVGYFQSGDLCNTNGIPGMYAMSVF